MIENQIWFEGILVMFDDKCVVFQKNFDYVIYVDVFGDENFVFKKVFQVLLNNVDYELLDLCGCCIMLLEFVDM